MATKQLPCEDWTWHHTTFPDKSWAGGCYFTAGGEWSPTAQPLVVSAQGPHASAPDQSYFTFGAGGNQGGEGHESAGEWFIEGVQEELDAPNEFWCGSPPAPLLRPNTGTSAARPIAASGFVLVCGCLCAGVPCCIQPSLFARVCACVCACVQGKAGSARPPTPLLPLGWGCQGGQGVRCGEQGGRPGRVGCAACRAAHRQPPPTAPSPWARPCSPVALA